MQEYRVKVYEDRTEWFNLDGKRHRVDGPAIEWADGDKEWYQNDKLHREDGPAIERPDGSTEWYVNDKLHREDCPAIERPNGYKAWYLNDEELTAAEFKAKAGIYAGREITIDGKTYILQPAEEVYILRPK